MTKNYYRYLDNAGSIWSVRIDPDIALFLRADDCVPAAPRVPGGVRTRQIRLADVVTGKEAQLVAPYPWPYDLGELVAYAGSIWYVTFHLDETYPLEKG